MDFVRDLYKISNC